MRSLTVIALVAGSVSAQTWTQLPDFPGTARDDATSFVLDNKIYVGTGMEVGWGLTNDWWCFDPATGTWNAIASMPSTPRQYCTSFTVIDTGYVFGGLDAGGALSELWAYHPESDSWEQKSSLPAEGRYACAASEGNLFGIVATGMLDSGTPTNEAWKYRTGDDSWEALNPVPGPARHRAAFFLGGGGLEIVGGADADFQPLSDAWYYPVWFETGLWYPALDLPVARYGGDGGGYVPIVACGATSETSFHDDVWLQWGPDYQAIAPFPGGGRRGGIGAGIVDEQFWLVDFYYGLGLDGSMVRHKDWWRLVQLVGIPDRTVGDLKLFPNPGTAAFGLSIPHPPEIRITDARGTQLPAVRVMPDGQIDASDWPSGLYLVTAVDNNGRSYRARWIKL